MIATSCLSFSLWNGTTILLVLPLTWVVLPPVVAIAAVAVHSSNHPTDRMIWLKFES